ncbi:MAG: 50S ribosomal protein L23 [Patescibacteria group bacterium]
MNIYQVLKKPIVSEKGYAQARAGKYLFEVSPDATKGEIAKAIETVYKGTKVSKVAISRSPAKETRWRTPKKRPVRSFQSGKKKALVTLSEGKIEFFAEK